MEDPVQTHIPNFVDLGLANINALNEDSGISTPATRILRPMYGALWSVHNNIFGETTAVGVIEEKYDYNYNYKNESQIWKENKKSEHQNISMSRPTLELTPIGTKTPDVKNYLWNRLLLVQEQ